jgi:hypothetical protein
MENYKQTNESGLYQPPTTGVLRGWLKQYDLSRSEFARLLGFKDGASMYKFFTDASVHTPLPYSCVRYFLIWSGQIKPDSYLDKLDPFFQKLYTLFPALNVCNLVDFVNMYLDINVTEFYHYKKNDRIYLEKLINDVLEACDIPVIDV